jgi:hypothetical protein
MIKCAAADAIQSVRFIVRTVLLFSNVLRQHTYGAYELFLSPFAFFCSSVHTCDRSRRATGTRTAVLAPNVSLQHAASWQDRVERTAQQVPYVRHPETGRMTHGTTRADSC